MPLMPVYAWGAIVFWGALAAALWRWDWRGRERPPADSGTDDAWDQML